MLKQHRAPEINHKGVYLPIKIEIPKFSRTTQPFQNEHQN
jgi:hypothetical protein